MVLPLWGPLCDLSRAALSGAGLRAISTCITILLSLIAAGFLVAAGFAGLMRAVGFPVTAFIFAILFAALALISHLIGREVSARQTARVLAATSRVKTDVALAAVLARSARPLLPIAAFLAAFTLARRP